MTLDALVARLPEARRSGRGWVSRCPADGGRRLKLAIREGERGLLVKCWAGCSLREITAALGLTVRDLFFDAELTYRQVNRRERPSPKPRRLDWRRTSVDLMNHADALWLRGTSVLALATDVQDRHSWSEIDLDAAIKAVGLAYEDLDRANLLEAVAFDLRTTGLQNEKAQCRR